MKRHVLSVAMLFICSSLLAPQIKAQPNAFTSLEEAALNMTKWFNTMLDSVGSLAATENKRRLVVSLTNLNKAIYDLEQDKRHLVLLTQRDDVNFHGLGEVISSMIRPNLERTKDAMRKTGLQLRKQYRAGGDEIEEQLNSALDGKIWVYNFDQIMRVGGGKDAIRHEAEASANALHDAGLALTKLIDAVKEQR